MQRVAIACAAITALVSANPAPVPQLDLAQLAAATPVPQGPQPIGDADGEQSATLYTSLTITGVATAQATGTVQKREWQDTSYSPYYPALATGYTTDPALAATSTTTANQPCVTQPEAGTYCGFLNPLDPCAPQPDGYGPVPTPDTASAFLKYSKLHQYAQSAPTKVPSADGNQYTQVFKDLNAQVQGSSYLRLYTLKTYSVPDCAARCDATDLCTSFNIFAERDPSLNPTNNDSTYDPGYPTVWGQNCPNPASMTSFKCTLFGSNIDSSMATNSGQKREEFEIVITASNGYDKTDKVTPPDCTAPGTTSTTAAATKSIGKPTKSTSQPKPTKNPWKKPENCGKKGINAPKYNMGGKFFPGPFNPQACSNYALLQNEVNVKAGKGQCQMFNAYYLHKNGIPFGTYCSLFSTYLSPNKWATIGTTFGLGKNADKYECKQSWSYTLDVSASASFGVPNFSSWFPKSW